MKILVIALSGIGDALMFTPALKLLKTQLPDANIDALVMFDGAKEIYESNTNLTSIHNYNFLKEGNVKSLKYLLGLRKKYDVTINVYPSNRKEYNVISFLIGAPRRAAVRYLRKHNLNLGFLNNVSVLENDSVHNVQTNIKLCEAIIGKKFVDEPPMELSLSNEDLNYAQYFFNQHSIDENDLVIGFHPGCATLKNHIKRRWEAEKFAELGKKLIHEHQAKILIFGGPDEEELKNNILNQINSERVIIVKTEKLSQSTSILNRCNVFVTNDSSQMHIASALQRKVISIIGPTNPHYIHPWKTEHTIVRLYLDCAPCFFYSPRPLICSRDDVKFKCIKELSIEMVYDAVVQLI
jgi:heptosyltransferase-2